MTYVTSLPVAANYKGKHTTNLSIFYILYEYTHFTEPGLDQDNR